MWEGLVWPLPWDPLGLEAPAGACGGGGRLVEVGAETLSAIVNRNQVLRLYQKRLDEERMMQRKIGGGKKSLVESVGRYDGWRLKQ